MGEWHNMNKQIVKLEEYRDALLNKKKLDDGSSTVDDLSLEELEDVGKLYKSEISMLMKDVQALEKENMLLKRMLNK